MTESRSAGLTRREILRAGAASAAAALVGTRAAWGQAKVAPVPVSIAWQPAVSIPPFYAAEKNGLFEQAGLVPKYLKFLSGPAIFASLQSGDVDVAEMGALPAIVGRSQGIAMRIVALSGDASANYTLIGRPGIRSMADLKGKKIVAVTGSNYHFVLAKSLERAGLTFKDIEHVNLSPGDTVPAFRNGDVDAVWLASPWTERLVEVGGVRVTDAPAEGILAPSIWVARVDWMKKYPDGMLRWMKAMEAGLMDYRRDPSTIAAIAAERMAIPKSDVEAVMKQVKVSTFKEQVSPEHPLSLTKGFPAGDGGLSQLVKQNMEFLVGLGRIRATYPVADLIDPQPATLYAKSQG
jgi:ABC-type nitrate/sulfonate/bicarbonate transport system substrate-binding protein